MKEIDAEAVRGRLATQGVTWRFNPPLAPHFNGVHEVLVKAAKRAMKAILGDAKINDDELHTAIVGAEALMNSRPLTVASADPRDDLPLTPNHFLYGRAEVQVEPSGADSGNYGPRVRWRRVQELVSHFWRRWMREWVPGLSPRRKWQKNNPDLQQGDVVLEVDPATPRGRWRLGRIVETHPGQDGHVRTVSVRFGDSVLKRPVVRLCPLERQGDASDGEKGQSSDALCGGE